MVDEAVEFGRVFFDEFVKGSGVPFAGTGDEVRVGVDTVTFPPIRGRDRRSSFCSSGFHSDGGGPESLGVRQE